jgi:hypothetical protein
MDFRPTLISPPSWIFCQKFNGIVFRGQKSVRNYTSLSPPSIAHGIDFSYTIEKNSKSRYIFDFLKDFSNQNFRSLAVVLRKKNISTLQNSNIKLAQKTQSQIFSSSAISSTAATQPTRDRRKKSLNSFFSYKK